MNKIRIGNDIRMQLTLKGVRDFDQSNIKLFKCYLVNESCKDGKCAINRRFPLEPFPLYYTPTNYTLNTCGEHRYHIDPWNTKCSYDGFGGGFNDYHIWPQYHGFGFHPGHFRDCCCNPWHHCNCCHHHCHKPDNRYLAPSRVLEGRNKIEVYFPAVDLYHAGIYRLIVVMVVYEKGWGHADLHTYTIDYGSAFELVTDETGASGNVTLDIDNNSVTTPPILLYMDEHGFRINENSKFLLGDVDLQNREYNFYLDFGESQRLYDISNDLYKFTWVSSNPDVLTTDDFGNLYSKETVEDTKVTVTIYLKEDPNINVEFNVIVAANEMSYIGFSTAETAYNLNVNELDKVNNIFGTHILENKKNGAFLWLVSTQRIKDANSKLFDVPLDAELTKSIDNVTYYCYRCPNAIKTNIKFDISVSQY